MTDACCPDCVESLRFARSGVGWLVRLDEWHHRQHRWLPAWGYRIFLPLCRRVNQ